MRRHPESGVDINVTKKHMASVQTGALELFLCESMTGVYFKINLQHPVDSIVLAVQTTADFTSA